MEGNIIEEYKLGNTRIKISDKYIVKTEEEANEIIKRLSRIAVEAIREEIYLRNLEKKQQP